MNGTIDVLNSVSAAFVKNSFAMLIQSSLLILLVMGLDFIFRKKIRAIVRYCLWMLVLVKLVLPTTLAMPTGVGYWLGGGFLNPEIAQAQPPITTVSVPERTDSPIDSYAPRVGIKTSDVPVYTSTFMNNAAPATVSKPSIGPQSLPQPVAVNIVNTVYPAVTWQTVAFICWLVVVAGMVLWLFQRIMFVRGLIRQAMSAGDGLQILLDECKRTAGISPRRRIDIRLSTSSASPAICGLFRPVILMPEFLPGKMGRQELRAVLLHELIHLKRGDLWINTVQTLLQIINFYNPLLWVANAIIRRVREQAVDEAVMVTMGQGSENYPQALLNVAGLALSRPALSLRLVGVVESKSALAGRIKHILSRPLPKSAKLGIAGAAMLLTFAAVFLPMAGASQKPAANEPKTEKTEKENTVNQVDENKKLSGKKPDDFKVTLSNGVTVELLAITTGKYKGKNVWWRPDGVLLPEYKYPWDNITKPLADLIKQLKVEDFKFVFAYRLICHDFKGVNHWVGSSEGLGGWHNDKRLQKDNGYAICMIGCVSKGDSDHIDQNQLPKSTTIRIAVASGSFGNSTVTASSEIHQLSEKGYFKSSIRISGANAVLTGNWIDNSQHDKGIDVTANVTRGDLDFILSCNTGGQDRDFPDWEGGSFSGSTIVNPQPGYDSMVSRGFKVTVNPDDTSCIFLKYRLFELAEFENVSLVPGQKTDVKIIAEEPLQKKMINWVEEFFAENFPNLNKPKTIEWSFPYAVNENLSIRRFYEHVVDQGTRVENQVFTFKPDGELVDVKDVEKFPFISDKNGRTHIKSLIPDKSLKQLIDKYNSSISKKSVATQQDVKTADTLSKTKFLPDDFKDVTAPEPTTTITESHALPVKKMSLSHDNGKSEGMRSIAGSGHGKKFEVPANGYKLMAIKIFGSRYGYPQPPKEDFHVWLCDSEYKVLKEFVFPYSTFERGNPKWVTLAVTPTAVPEKFVIFVGFNPERTKGVYVHYSTAEGNDSMVGLPGGGISDFTKGNWMIRCELKYDPSNSSVKSNESTDGRPQIVETSPAAFANDVSPEVDKITVTFDRKMMDGSWSWTGGGDTFPKGAGKISYDADCTTCTLPVKLEPGKVYWVGINSPSHRNFKTDERVPAKRYVILFATKDADGKPTPIPQNMLDRAKKINSRK